MINHDFQHDLMLILLYLVVFSYCVLSQKFHQSSRQFVLGEAHRNKGNRTPTPTGPKPKLVSYPANLVNVTSQYKSYFLNNSDDLSALREFAKEINTLPNKQSEIEKFCLLRKIGRGWGAHYLCTYGEDLTRIFSLYGNCYFLSFGISTDFSFDRELGAEPFNCKGFAFDPTVDHPANLTNNIVFLKAAAHSPVLVKEWSSFSVPGFRNLINHPLFVLKMDCEGCEYVLAYDILQDDPSLLERLQQLNIEVHTPKSFLKTENDVYGLGRLYRLLQLAGFQLIHIDDGRCHPAEENLGCLPLLTETGFACLPGCRSFLFAKAYKQSIV